MSLNLETETPTRYAADRYQSLADQVLNGEPISREEAISTMRRALKEMQVEGIETTAAFHDMVLQHKDFIEGQHDTKWVERELMD